MNIYERVHNVKKSICLLCSFVVLILFSGGCARHEDTSASEKETAAEEDYEMTNEEKRFLKSIYIDEERIEDVLLYSYQKKCSRITVSP